MIGIPIECLPIEFGFDHVCICVISEVIHNSPDVIIKEEMVQGDVARHRWFIIGKIQNEKLGVFFGSSSVVCCLFAKLSQSFLLMSIKYDLYVETVLSDLKTFMKNLIDKSTADLIESKSRQLGKYMGNWRSSNLGYLLPTRSPSLGP